MRSAWLLVGGAVLALVAVRPVYSVRGPRAHAGVKPETAAATEFFEARVRPVLAERCNGCHTGAKAAAGLDLSLRASFLRSGPHGAAVVPGDLERSRLIQAVRRSGPLKMPPDSPLPDAQVRDLETWVRAGAPWPDPVQGPAEMTHDLGPGTPDLGPRWALQPVRKPAVPSVQDRAWVKTPIDAFVLQRLEAQHLRPSPQADRRTLIRRATFDLTGLPPTRGEVDAFVNDASPDAWARVDRLLASPRYGERWGRFWLDAARYADTKDYVYAGERRYPFSYAYRDYVIRAFNQDLPYNQFLLQQLAADQLPLGKDKRPLAALGFLTLGRRFVNVESDIVDDRIDVVFRTTQALTVGCARCHDHKYDPIPTKDYYSLYGVFSATTEKTVQIAPDPAPSAEFQTYAAELAKRQARLENAVTQKSAELSAQLRRQVGDYLVRVAEQGMQPGEGVYLVMGAGDINPLIVHKWRVYINQRSSGDAVFGPWHAFESIPAKAFASEAPAVASRIARNVDGRVDPQLAALFRGKAPASMKEVAERYGALLAHAASPAVKRVLFADDSPTTVPHLSVGDLDYYFDENSRKLLNGLQAEVDGWYIKSPVTPEHALILTDRPNPPQPHVFIRGNRANEGPAVPRQFLQALSGPYRQPFRHGSGRLELARAIASRENPLTARVMVNRVWLGHFGAGLVRTPSDFGARGERPTHPELLDWLATRFMESGWSLKWLHRLIMLSSVYQQASDDRPEGLGADPQNALLWKMNRHRLEFEALRDSLLSVSGQLDMRMGGRPVDLLAEPAAPRRSVYGFVDRQNLPGLLRMFNVPSGDQHSPQRYVTTSPQQALFMMNSPFVTGCAKNLVDRGHLACTDDPESGIRMLYLRIYQREPSPSELRLGEEFLAEAGGVNWTNLPRLVSHTKPGLNPWEQYAQALLLTNEFAFVD